MIALKVMAMRADLDATSEPAVLESGASDHRIPVCAVVSGLVVRD